MIKEIKIMALEIGKTYYIKNVATGKYLNVYGNDTVVNERNVNVYTKEDVLAQKWIVRLAGNGAQVHTAINEDFALNIYTVNNNCSMYKVAENSLDDSVVDFLTVDSDQNLYRIQIMAYSLYLTVNTSTDNAYFGTDNESFYALWQLEEVGTSEYTNILTRYTTPLSNMNGVITVYNIPDCTKGSTNYIEYTCEMHKGSMIPDGTNFADDNNATVTNIKSAINSLITKVYPEGTSISDINKYYYLFGEKRYDTTHSVCHNGVDIAGPDGAEIKALFGGEVTLADNSVFSVYNPGLGVIFNYVHMKDHKFSIGDNINAGDPIGYQSNVGDADESHLHFEVTAGRETAHSDTSSTSVDMASILPYGYMIG